MRISITKKIKSILFITGFQNIGYLPRWVIFVIDVFIVSFSCLITYAVLTNLGVKSNQVLRPLFQNISIVFVNGLSFILFRTYTGIIRHSTFIDGIKLLKANTITYFALLAVNYGCLSLLNIKVFLSTGLFITCVISFLLLFLFRILVKNLFESFLHFNAEKKLVNAVIYGADANAISVASALKTENPLRFNVVAFIDKFQNITTSKSILNLPIINQKKGIEVIMKSVSAEVLIIAEKSLTKEEIIDLVEDCLKYNFKVFSVPLITDWVDKKEISNQLQRFEIEDLLNRKPIVLNTNSISSQLQNKIILITGGAGSIGSEIVRQIITFKPKKIIILDQAETPLHSLCLEITEVKDTVEVIAVLSDIKDFNSLEAIFNRFRPDFVFHAAAYKHVPIMEENPSQAVFTNVIGTKNLADLSHKYFVEKFVMISTDKAVNPSSIMGASKRIAEKYVQSLNYHLLQTNKKSPTKYITTRFGNVLGSNGSIVPLFTKQIQEGGPITITHPEIIRYFMTIPEACQLVLEAGAMGSGGEIYIFDMGEPVKIIDLAKKMIRLAGFTPDNEIKIKIVGLRPGEKLYEELLNDTSRTLPTHNTKILIAQDTYEEFENVAIAISDLIETALHHSNEKIVFKMKEIVPEFKSMNSIFETLDK